MPSRDGKRKSPTWQAAQLARQIRRSQEREAGQLQQQARNSGGFLIKHGPDGVELIDPGKKDRQVWIDSHASGTSGPPA